MEKDTGKEQGWEPYEPTHGERAYLGNALRRQLVESIGGETIHRFVKGHGRLTYRLPYGAHMLEHADLETLGAHGSTRWLRASVEINFEGEGDQAYWNDPFRETVEFAFTSPESEAPIGKHRYAAAENAKMTCHAEQEKASPAKATVSGYSFKARAAIIGLLALTAAAGLEASGYTDIRGLINDRNEPPAAPATSTKDPGDTPPTVPPVFIPRDPWGLSRR